MEAEKTNPRILRRLREAGIPVILLIADRLPLWGGGRPDLVSINNRQAGYVATEHLIKLGCKRLGFLNYHGAALTITDRMTGYREALAAYGLKPATDAVMDTQAHGQLRCPGVGRRGWRHWTRLSVSTTESRGK